jgi:hypothetical protein
MLLAGTATAPGGTSAAAPPAPARIIRTAARLVIRHSAPAASGQAVI